jgi:hypothetical protein
MLRRQRVGIPAEDPLTMTEIAGWRSLRDEVAPG